MSPRRPFGALLCLAMACSSGSGGSARGPDDASEEDEAAEPESERDRLSRLAKARFAQCETLGDGIQRGEIGEDEIINLNDSEKLRRLSDARAAAAERVERIEVSTADLEPIKADYVRLARSMAAALRASADGKNVADRKAALKRYQELDGEAATIIERFNTVCGGGAQEPEPSAAKR